MSLSPVRFGAQYNLAPTSQQDDSALPPAKKPLRLKVQQIANLLDQFTRDGKDAVLLTSYPSYVGSYMKTSYGIQFRAEELLSASVGSVHRRADGLKNLFSAPGLEDLAILLTEEDAREFRKERPVFENVGLTDAYYQAIRQNPQAKTLTIA